MANSKPKYRTKARGKSKATPPSIPPEQIVRIQGATGLAIPDAKAKAIAAAHLAGMGVNQICKAFSTNSSTVAALIRNRPELLEQARDVTSKNWKTIAAMGTAEVLDRIPDMKDHGLVIMSAVATEKSELLSGGPTARIEHIAAPADQQWEQFLEGLKAKADAIDVEFEPVSTPAGDTEKTPTPSLPPPPPIDNETGRTQEHEWK
jgi:hypothetical protein